ncbi:MAG: hypothetical protein ABFQ95_04675 [Pseudomonadota bacterium]
MIINLQKTRRSCANHQQEFTLQVSKNLSRRGQYLTLINEKITVSNHNNYKLLNHKKLQSQSSLKKLIQNLTISCSGDVSIVGANQQVSSYFVQLNTFGNVNFQNFSAKNFNITANNLTNYGYSKILGTNQFKVKRVDNHGIFGLKDGNFDTDVYHGVKNSKLRVLGGVHLTYRDIKNYGDIDRGRKCKLTVEHDRPVTKIGHIKGQDELHLKLGAAVNPVQLLTDCNPKTSNITLDWPYPRSALLDTQKILDVAQQFYDMAQQFNRWSPHFNTYLKLAEQSLGAKTTRFPGKQALFNKIKNQYRTSAQNAEDKRRFKHWVNNLRARNLGLTTEQYERMAYNIVTRNLDLGTALVEVLDPVWYILPNMSKRNITKKVVQHMWQNNCNFKIAKQRVLQSLIPLAFYREQNITAQVAEVMVADICSYQRALATIKRTIEKAFFKKSTVVLDKHKLTKVLDLVVDNDYSRQDALMQVLPKFVFEGHDLTRKTILCMLNFKKTYQAAQKLVLVKHIQKYKILASLSLQAIQMLATQLLLNNRGTLAQLLPNVLAETNLFADQNFHFLENINLKDKACEKIADIMLKKQIQFRKAKVKFLNTLNSIKGVIEIKKDIIFLNTKQITDVSAFLWLICDPDGEFFARNTPVEKRQQIFTKTLVSYFSWVEQNRLLHLVGQDADLLEPMCQKVIEDLLDQSRNSCFFMNSFKIVCKMTEIILDQQMKNLRNRYEYLEFEKVRLIAVRNYLSLSDDLIKTIEAFLKENAYTLQLPTEEDKPDYMDLNYYYQGLANYLKDKPTIPGNPAPNYLDEITAFRSARVKHAAELKSRYFELTTPTCQQLAYYQDIEGLQHRVALGKVLGILYPIPNKLLHPECVPLHLRMLAKHNPAKLEAQVKKSFFLQVAELLIEAKGQLRIGKAIDQCHLNAQKKVLKNKGLLNKGLLLPEPLLTQVAKLSTRESHSYKTSLIRVLKCSRKFDSHSLSESQIAQLATDMLEGKLYPEAYYRLLVAQNHRGFADEPNAKLLALEQLGLLPCLTPVQFSRQLLTEISQKLYEFSGRVAKPGDMELTYVAYCCDQHYKNAEIRLEDEQLKGWWHRAQAFNNEHILKLLPLTKELFDVENFVLGDIKFSDFALYLLQQQITAQDLCQIHLVDLAKHYRAFADLIPTKSTLFLQELQERVRAGTQNSKNEQENFLRMSQSLSRGVQNFQNLIDNQLGLCGVALNYDMFIGHPAPYWQYDPRNKKYYDAVIIGMERFDECQWRQDGWKLNVQNIQHDPLVEIPALDQEVPYNITDIELQHIRTQLYNFVDQCNGWNFQEKADKKKVIGRFIGWSGFEAHIYNCRDADRAFAPKKQARYRKRLQRLYNRLFKDKLADPQQQSECMALLKVIDQARTCVDASSQVLETLEELISTNQDDIFARLANILRLARIEGVKAIGQQIANLVNPNEAIELILFMELACRIPFSLCLQAETMQYHAMFQVPVDNLSAIICGYLDEYRKNIIDIVADRVKTTPRPAGDQDSGTIYLEEIIQWAQNDPYFCNSFEDLTTQDGDRYIVKSSVLQKLLQRAGYLLVYDE